MALAVLDMIPIGRWHGQLDVANAVRADVLLDIIKFIKVVASAGVSDLSCTNWGRGLDFHVHNGLIVGQIRTQAVQVKGQLRKALEPVEKRAPEH